VQVYDYINPKPTKWPEAEFIVGNPPFIGKLRIREALGDGYVEALRLAYPRTPQTVDLVMYWWEKAALAARAWKLTTDKTRAKGTRRFGFITTNSLSQTFNRKVLETHLSDPKTPLSLIFAIPDHPWVDSVDGAAVRIAMTVAERGDRSGRLMSVANESKGELGAEGRIVTLSGEIGRIFADLSIDVNLLDCKPLKANRNLASVGYQINGKGFLVSDNLRQVLVALNPKISDVMKPWTNGIGIQRSAETRFAIDVSTLDESKVSSVYPEIYQHLLDQVYPERKENARRRVKEKWWIYEEPRNTFRPALRGLTNIIVTSLTASHRVFVQMPSDTVADSTTVMFALNDSAMSVFSSRFHVLWSLKQGALLGPTPRYNKSRCFDPFPFPTPTPDQTQKLRALGEQLDAHRKAQQVAHPKLTLTNMYNVLEKLRAGEKIEGKDKEIYDQGLIGILRDLHDQIDTAVAEAYGWPADLSDDDILHRLVALNRERAEEEAQGLVRWLRPEYQNPKGTQATTGKQAELDVGTTEKMEKAPWPKTLPEQISAVQAALRDMGEASPDQIARRFARGRAASVLPLLESLAALGQAEATQGGRYAM
jgi:hypothetical protein